MQILGHTGQDQDPHEIKVAYQRKVRNKVLELLEREYKDQYELLFDSTTGDENRKNNIALVFDFDETSMGPKAFRKAVIQCVEDALSALLPNTQDQ